MFRPIYEPRTRAREYSDLAINIYNGCNHGCTYCYAKGMHDRYKPTENFADVKPRDGIVEATKNQLSGGKYKGKKIMLCFMCDPYPAEIDTTPTREVIKLIKDAGANVSILTKGGLRAERDFDLLDKNDSFGVTYTGCRDGELFIQSTKEPNAAPPSERLATLGRAHKLGIKTWMSCEPVLYEYDIYTIIEQAEYVDLFKIGKLNYYPSDINWGEFGRKCERICKAHGRNYYIKEDLRREMAE
jgi:DNA repair photolyase